MVNLLITIIGEDDDCEEILFKGFKKFYPDKIILLTKDKYIKKSNKILKNLEKFDISVEIRTVTNSPQLEEIFIEINKISTLHSKDSIVINVDVDYMTSCLALSSAFVNGIAAIGVLDEKVISYPIMKFSYYNAINDKKMKILKILNSNKKVESMEKLSKLSEMSLPLIAYHLRGNRDSKGLVEMKLINTIKNESRVCVELTDLGRLIINGQVDCSIENNSKKNKKKH